MAAAFEPYVVRQGDYLLRLAVERGFDANAVWNDPKNAELKRLRNDPMMLLAGDVIYVPKRKRKWFSVNVGNVNQFMGTIPQVRVSACFMCDGKPLAGERYLLQGVPSSNGPGAGSDSTEPLTTGQDGVVTVSVPTTTSSFNVHFIDRNELHTVLVGHLDPADEPSGARMRLGLLGFYGLPGGAAQVSGRGDDLEAGLRSFQRKYNLTLTGRLDPPTVAKLVSVFGS